VIGIIKRRALIKELASAYHAECRTYCQDLLQLQKKWEEVLCLSQILFRMKHFAYLSLHFYEFLQSTNRNTTKSNSLQFSVIDDRPYTVFNGTLAGTMKNA
jgi:hypothetical protein